MENYIKIKSRRLNREIIIARALNGYLWVVGLEGKSYQQLVAGGRLFDGPTLWAKPEDFERLARRWWRQWLLNSRQL